MCSQFASRARVIDVFAGRQSRSQDVSQYSRFFLHPPLPPQHLSD